MLVEQLFGRFMALSCARRRTFIGKDDRLAGSISHGDNSRGRRKGCTLRACTSHF